MLLSLIAAASLHTGTVISLGVFTPQDAQVDPSVVKQMKPIPSDKRGSKTSVPKHMSLSEKQLNTMLHDAEKLGNLKLGGGGIGGPVAHFLGGELTLTHVPSWCTEGHLSYNSAAAVGWSGASFSDLVGSADLRAMTVQMRGLRASMVVVEIHVYVDEDVHPGSRMQVRAPDNTLNVQMLRSSGDRVAVFLVQADPSTHDAFLVVEVPDAHLSIQEVTVRPVG